MQCMTILYIMSFDRRTYDMFWYTVTQVRCMYILEESVGFKEKS